MFEMNTFSYLKNTKFSYLKMTFFCSCKWHVFRIWRRHISYFKTAHFIFNNNNTSWQSKNENINIRNVNIWNVKLIGQSQTAKIWSEGFKIFKVTNLKWQNNMGNANIRDVKFRQGEDKQQKFDAQLSKFQGFKF